MYVGSRATNHTQDRRAATSYNDDVTVALKKRVRKILAAAPVRAVQYIHYVQHTVHTYALTTVCMYIRTYCIYYTYEELLWKLF